MSYKNKKEVGKEISSIAHENSIKISRKKIYSIWKAQTSIENIDLTFFSGNEGMKNSIPDLFIQKKESSKMLWQMRI